MSVKFDEIIFDSQKTIAHYAARIDQLTKDKIHTDALDVTLFMQIDRLLKEPIKNKDRCAKIRSDLASILVSRGWCIYCASLLCECQDCA